MGERATSFEAAIQNGLATPPEAASILTTRGTCMASSTTGSKSLGARGGWLDRSKSRLALFAALAGLGLLVCALFLGAPFSLMEEPGPLEAGVIAGSQPVWTALDTEVPADLLPEEIRLPRFPSPDELKRQERDAPSEDREDRKDSPSGSFSLTALKVTRVRFQTPMPTQVAFALPEAPDQLMAGVISQARFGDGAGRAGRRGREAGWGGVGVGGVGIGRVGGGTCGRNPAGPTIIHRGSGFPK